MPPNIGSDLLLLFQKRVEIETKAAVHVGVLWQEGQLGLVRGDNGGVELLAVQDHTLHCDVQDMGGTLGA